MSFPVPVVVPVVQVVVSVILVPVVVLIPVAFLVSMVFPVVVAFQKRADYHEQTPDLTGLSETFLGMVVDSVGGVPPMTLPVVASLSHSYHREWYILTSSPPLGMVNSPVVFHLLIPLLGLDTPF
jgi:type IV secretory pathway VirB6-like protein